MSTWSRMLDVYGSWWSRVEARWAAWLRRRRSRIEGHARQIGDEARQLGDQALQLGFELWDKVDDLPFFPPFLKIKPVHRRFYGHGAYMGAAPALLADPAWRRILAFLMPDVYGDVSAAVGQGARSPDIIPMFENNPVMCAFGVLRGRRGEAGDDEDGDLAGMEWDVFIDGELAGEHAAAAPEKCAELAARIVESMVIAHASTTDTLQEALGLCQFRDVRKTRKTTLGGVPARPWLDLFARALVLATAPDLGEAIRVMAAEPRTESEEECLRFTFAEPMPTERAVEVYRDLTGRDDFSVVLEIKSLRSTPALLADIVADLNRRGVHVAAVCSFLLDEIRGVSAMRQRVGDRELGGPREVMFFHYAGDLQQACDEGRLPPGLCVLFNGASLLDHHHPSSDVPPVYTVKEDVVAEVREYRRRHGLHIGVYVQEGDCDEGAAGLLSDLVARAPDAIDLGFAWGGLADEVSIGRGDEPRLGYGAQRALGLVGKARHWQVASPDSTGSGG